MCKLNSESVIQYAEADRSVLLSVIIPVKTPCKYLAESLRSLKFNNLNEIEVIIVVTSGLESSEEEILSSLGLRFKVISQEAKGVYAAMNHGLSLAVGKFVYFLGSGDTLRQDVLSKFIKCIQSAWGQVLIFKVLMPSDKQHPVFEVFAEHVRNGFMPCHQGIVMSRKLINTLGGFDTRFSIAADFDLLVRSTRENALIQNLDLCIAKYLGGGISTNGALREQFLSLYINGFRYQSFRFIFVESCARFYRRYIKPYKQVPSH